MNGSGGEITKNTSVHGVFEYEPKEDRFELFEKDKKIHLMNPSREMTQFKMKMKIQLQQTEKKETFILKTLWKIDIIIQKLKRGASTEKIF